MKKMPEKKEFPDIDELVICIVKKMAGTTIFLELEDYNKEGVMHFSEVAPGRIRNIRDYVAPNKRIVCKVLRIDKTKGNIDLSLRRVSIKDQKNKLAEYNKEKGRTILLRLVADEPTIKKIKYEFNSINIFFEKFIENKNIADKFFKKDQIEKLFKLIKEREKEKRVRVTLKIKLQHSGSNGIEIIKEILEKNKNGLEISYISAPLYSITLENKNYKEANKKINEIAETIMQYIKERGGKGEIIQTKK